MFEIYKRGQGVTARWITAISLGALFIFGCVELRDYLTTRGLSDTGSTVVSTVIFVASVVLVAWLINWPKFVDYLIVSEAELRKVSWPTRDELKRQTIVVIFALLAFSAVLLAADLIFGGAMRILYRL